MIASGCCRRLAAKPRRSLAKRGVNDKLPRVETGWTRTPLSENVHQGEAGWDR